MSKSPAIETLESEAQQIFDDIFGRLEDPDDQLFSWLDARGVHGELYVFTGDSPWQEVLDAGAELHASAAESGRRLFRTEGDSDTTVFFIADSADQILRLLRQFRDEDMVVIQVMAS